MFILHKLSSGIPTALKILTKTQYASVSTIGGSRGMKVTIVGAGGQVGQPLAFMLKNSPYFDELALHDVCGTSGLCAELSHIDTKCRVSSYKGRTQEALEGAQIVVIVASAPGMAACDFDTMFKPNAAVVFDIVASCARFCPKAQLVIATNPVNSMVPIASEVLRKFHVYNPSIVFGVTTLDVMRANMGVARVQGVRPEKINVPVIGGHSCRTVVPVLSNSTPQLEFDNEELIEITTNVQEATENNLQSKKPGGLCLSSAFAISRFVMSLARAICGESNIIECALVRSDVYLDLPYLATPLKLGFNGVQKNLGIPPLSDYEDCQLQNAAKALRDEIALGVSFATGKGYKPGFKPAKPRDEPPVGCINDLDVCNPCT